MALVAFPTGHLVEALDLFHDQAGFGGLGVGDVDGVALVAGDLVEFAGQDAGGDPTESVLKASDQDLRCDDAVAHEGILQQALVTRHEDQIGPERQQIPQELIARVWGVEH